MTESYISFPHIGLSFNIDNVAFTIGSKEIYWYGIIIAFGFLLAILCALRLAKISSMSTDSVIDLVIYGAPAAIVGARLYYVIFEWEHYGAHPGDIIKIWNGGLAIYGGILTAIAVAVIYCKIKKENLPLLCDIGAVGLLIGQSVGRWGNFVNQEAFGGNTNLPWAMTGDVIVSELTLMAAKGMDVDPSVPVHPTFLYESLWNMMFAVLFIIIFPRRRFDGQIFASYLISYGLGRFFIEALRTDSLMIGSLRVSQLVALGCVIAGLCIIVYKLKKTEKN